MSALSSRRPRSEPATSPLGPGPLGWFLGIEDTCVHPRPTDEFPPLDEHVLTGHHRHWRHDLDRAAQIGAQGIRYGMSWPVVHVAPDRFDWSVLDGPLRHASDLGLHVMADLVHYGCPPWLEGSFIDADFVDALDSFTSALVDRYGDVLGSITPINEPLTTASFCGQRAVWPPALGTDEGWAAVVTSLAEAIQHVTRTVRAQAPHLAVVHVEAGHLYETEDQRLVNEVLRHRMLGDLPTDLALGICTPHSDGWGWLVDHGIDPRRLERLGDGAPQPDILGVNYYPDLTPRVLARGDDDQLLQLTVDRGAAGLARVLHDAARRYELPLAVTETSIEGSPDDRARWLDATVGQISQCRADGIDVRAVTWWPMIDFIDWSYIADGASVEEFVSGVVDPDTQRLVPVAAPIRDRNDGMSAFTRRMGLFDLDEPDARRTLNAAASRFGEHSGGRVPAPGPVINGGPALDRPAGTIVDLDGDWTLSLPDGTTRPITVPGLWEAQGHPTLDGRARYRRTFKANDPRGWWTLRFGAVMDTGHVRLNDTDVGRGNLPYTPWIVDVTGIIENDNVLEVTVDDPPAGSSAHLSSAHGKQGWANHEFPSPPSLYLTYGGIWQSVTLHRHGQIAVRDIACDLDPVAPTVTVELEALPPTAASGDDVVAVELTVALGNHTRTTPQVVRAGERTHVAVVFDGGDLAPWSPSHPVLHRCEVVARVDGLRSDQASLEVGLRRVAVGDHGLLLNGNPIQVRSALVQGFHATALYAEGTADDIEHEVRLAKSLGFNMLRLHLRAFDPRYLAACDRLGMLLHCDIPIAEPIAHDLVDDVGPIARQAADTLTAQVQRDRSHPSIVVWSVMNELGLDRAGLRSTDRYERFVRHLMDVMASVDQTRPVIENDWVDPDPDRIFVAPLATAHWYGHLDTAYLRELAARCDAAADERLPVLVTELGDWALPTADTARGHFYDHREAYERMLEETWWPGDLDSFAHATQRYQGLADRLQIDAIRRSGATGGYCVTQLTDVPWEFNGLLDIHRRRKSGNVSHIVAANRPVSPILSGPDFGCREDTPLTLTAHLVNDRPRRRLVRASVSIGDGPSVSMSTIQVQAYSSVVLGTTTIAAPPTVGENVVRLEVRDVEDETSWVSEYPVIVHPPVPSTPVVMNSIDPLAAELIASTPGWSHSNEARLLLVGEGAWTQVQDAADTHLRSGGVALVMAQGANHSGHPAAKRLEPIRSEWGGTPFRYTTDTPVVAAFPHRAVLDLHDADIAPDAVVVTSVAPSTVAVGVFKPPPRPAAGLVLGAVPVGRGIVVVCQYRLHNRAMAGGATARAVLDDVVRWAATLAEPAVAEIDRRPAARPVRPGSLPT